MIHAILTVLVTLTLLFPYTTEAGNDRTLLITEHTTVSASVLVPRTTAPDSAICEKTRNLVAQTLARHIQEHYLPASAAAGEFPFHYTCRSTADQSQLEFTMTVTLPRSTAPSDSLRTVLDGPLR